jgi:hypothetical protein
VSGLVGRLSSALSPIPSFDRSPADKAHATSVRQMSKPYLIFTTAHEKKKCGEGLTLVNGVDASTLLICKYTIETSKRPHKIANCFRLLATKWKGWMV